MSIQFPSVILGPEMAEPILWAPGIFGFFVLESPHAHKIPPCIPGGVGFFWRGGGVEVPILFLWPWGFFRFLRLGVFGSVAGRRGRNPRVLAR